MQLISRRDQRRGHAPRIALALAGGGPLGAAYEIGALCALEEAFDGVEFHRLQHYVGVSAGGFVAAALANGLRPRAVYAAFIDSSGREAEVFDPAWLMVPAYREFVRSAARLPLLACTAAWHVARGRQPLIHLLERLGPALPTGIFSNEQVHLRLERILSQPGRSNDFRQLGTRLSLVATDLDSGEPIAFGAPGWDHVPISRAVQASSALPGLFPPVQIDGRSFVDGVLKKTMHASIALEQGVDLMLCINPLVPFQASPRGIPRLAQVGLPGVLSQALRSLIHSRLELRMKEYARSYPDTDILLFEPQASDPVLYLANTFGYRQRRELAEHAYQQTRGMLLAQRATLAPRLNRHGITLRVDRLGDVRRTLVAPKPITRLAAAVADLRATLDTLDRQLQQA